MSAAEFGDLAKPSNSAAQLVRDGWFSETEALWPGEPQAACIVVASTMHGCRLLLPLGSE